VASTTLRHHHHAAAPIPPTHPRAQRRYPHLNVVTLNARQQHQPIVRNRREAIGDIRLDDPPLALEGLIDEHLQGVVRRSLGPKPKAAQLHGIMSASKIGSSTILLSRA
jgi:hypothetical protein